MVNDARPGVVKMVEPHDSADQLFNELQECKRRVSYLEQEHEIHKSLLTSTPDAIVMYDMQGRVVYVNEAFVQTFGWTQDELLGKGIPYTPESEREATLAKIRHVIDGGGIVSGWETRRHTKDGRTLDINLSASRFHDHRGVPAGMVVILRDISERKVAEKALRDSEASYRSIFDSMHDAIFVHDVETGKIIDVNRQMRQMYGYTAEEARELSVGELSAGAPPYSQDDALRYIRNAVNGLPQQFEWLAKDRNGRSFWVEVNLTKAEIGGQDRALAVVRDITDRKAAEETLRREEELQRTILATSPVGIGLAKDRKIVWVNEAWLKIFGFGYEDFARMDGSTRVLYPSEEEFQRVGEVLYRNLEEGGVNETEAQMRRVDGSVFQAHIAVKAVDPSDIGRGTIATIMDISARKRAERDREDLRKLLYQAQKMQAVGTLAGGIAHDFNNMLTIILGYSELLLEELTEDDPIHADLTKILQAARDGADLVQRLLAFSRQKESQRAPMDLNAQITRLQKLLSKTIPKMVTIELKLAQELAPVNADASQIDQIVMNLAVNACEAMPDGGKLTIATQSVVLGDDSRSQRLGARPGKYVLLSVSDTGRGLNEDQLSRIFDPFFTTKGWDSRKGTGLGLAIVHGVVQQHEGYIDCSSQVGKGTTFCIYLPVAEPEKELRAADVGEEPQKGAETILLVDDEESIRELGQRRLKQVGYTVLTASTGQEALDLYNEKKEQISLVILDLLMPEMGGVQCLKELLLINPHVKALIASGCCPGSAEPETATLGAKGFVTKPFEGKQLLQAIRNVLDTD
jgi:PAS domain S-box-containing protein